MLVAKAAGAIENANLYENLQQQYLQTVKSFAQALEAKDSYTHGHSQQVMRYAELIARTIELPESDISTLRQAAILHDIGKIGIAEELLSLPRQLTVEEYEEVKTHPLKGRNIISPITALAPVVPVVYHHHEHWDGNGYPEGLRHQEIPLLARIIGVADAFDAMTSSRPYRHALAADAAICELRRQAGKQFDPQMVIAFIKNQDKVKTLMRSRGED